MAYVHKTTVAQSFAEVGRYMSAAYSQTVRDEPPEQAAVDF
jgi:hypothetical protein